MAMRRRSTRVSAATAAASVAVPPNPRVQNLQPQKSSHNQHRSPQVQMQCPPQAAVHMGETHTVSEQGVTVSQSVEIVQTFLYSAISSILYFRELLPEDRFRPLFYATINQSCSYSKWVSATTNVPHSNERQSRGYTMQILRKGSTTRGDRIVEWLERGVFGAVQKGYVKALHMSIFQDVNHPDHVLELYTFKFHYKNNPTTGSPTLADVDMQDPSGATLTLKDARETLNTVVRNMVQLCGVMPMLPDRRQVKLHISWNSNRPPKYLPEGFKDTMDDLVCFPTAGWKVETSICGTMATGFRNVGLEVAYAKHVALEPVNSGEAVVMPDDLEYGTPISMSGDAGVVASAEAEKEGEYGCVSTVRIDQQLHKDVPDTDSHPHAQGMRSNELGHSFTNEGTGEAVDLSDVTVLKEPKVILHTAHATSLPSEKECNSLSTKFAVSHMLLPVPNGEFTQITQPVPHSYEPSQRIKFSNSVMKRMDISRSKQLPDRDHKTQVRTRSEKSGAVATNDIIRCQCGQDDEDDDMILCAFCLTWQHLSCFGYRGLNDGRLPEDHACYECLLQGGESDLLGRLRNLAWRRRAVHVIGQGDFDTDTQLQNALRCELTDVKRLVKDLDADGFLALSKSSRKLKGKRKIVFGDSDDQRRRIAAKFHSPTDGINHLIELPAFVQETELTYRRTQRELDQTDRSQSSQPARELSREEPQHGLARLEQQLGKRPRGNSFQSPSRSKKRVMSTSCEPAVDFTAILTPQKR